jgi:hypothetical protein
MKGARYPIDGSAAPHDPFGADPYLRPNGILRIRDAPAADQHGNEENSF